MAKKVTSMVSIDSLLLEYNKLREEKKTIEARMKKLSEDIKDYAEKNGVKDDKGSFYAENNSFTFGKQAKKSISFIQDKALEFFKKRKLVEAIKVVETIDEEAVEKYIKDGAITFKDLEEITETKVTYAIDIKKKEEMPEVEQTTVQLVASKKPKLNLKGGKK